MFKEVPSQVWLLILIAVVAYAPACYVYSHITHFPSRRDITAPPEDLSWRTSSQFFRSLAILGALTAFGIFIFTPAAAQLARSPMLGPILMVACGAWVLFTVPHGFIAGKVQPFIRGFNNSYERETQPKRFWLSIFWNTGFGFLCVWLAYVMIREGPAQALETQCYDRKTIYSPQEELSACNTLLGNRDESDIDFADLIGARGYAYHRLNDYEHAVADYSTAIRLDPKNSYLLFNRGIIYDLRYEYPLALADYSGSIRLRPTNAAAYISRGTIFLNTGRYKKAIDDFTRAHQLDPKNSVPLAGRGMAYAWRYDQVRAGQDFAEVRTIDPSNHVLLRGEALLSLNEGNLRGAVKGLSAALSKNPKDMWSLSMRAEAYRRLGELDKSQADTNELMRLSKETERERAGPS